jgi:hypothetical protein
MRRETVRLRVGQKLVSAVDTTAVIVIRPGSDEVVVTCGGVAMVSEQASGEQLAPAPSPANCGEGTQIGKRYETSDGAIELLCTKAGPASLAVDDVPLTIKAAKALPASD